MLPRDKPFLPCLKDIQYNNLENKKYMSIYEFLKWKLFVYHIILNISMVIERNGVDFVSGTQNGMFL